LTATDLLMNTSGSTLTNRTPRLTRSPKATCCSRIRPVPPAWRQIRT
jgi:hypothetical protein